jgi:Flp pilus assembly protein CpaB
VTSAALAGLLALRMDARTPVLVAARDLPVGHEITRADLATVPVSAAGLQLLGRNQAGLVIGKFVTQAVPAGRPLDLAMVGSQSLLRSGYVAVGIPLKAGAAPASGLNSGDVVNLVQAHDGEGRLLVAGAVVSSVRVPRSGGFGSSGGEASATVIVKDEQGDAGQLLSTELAAAAAAGEVVVILVERQGS